MQKALLLDIGKTLVGFSLDPKIERLLQYTPLSRAVLTKRVEGSESQEILHQFERSELRPEEYRKEVSRLWECEGMPVDTFWEMHTSIMTENDIDLPFVKYLTDIKKQYPATQLISVSNIDRTRYHHVTRLLALWGFTFDENLSSFTLMQRKPTKAYHAMVVAIVHGDMGFSLDDLFAFDDLPDNVKAWEDVRVRAHHHDASRTDVAIAAIESFL